MNTTDDRTYKIELLSKNGHVLHEAPATLDGLETREDLLKLAENRLSLGRILARGDFGGAPWGATMPVAARIRDCRGWVVDQVS